MGSGENLVLLLILLCYLSCLLLLLKIQGLLLLLHRVHRPHTSHVSHTSHGTAACRRCHSLLLLHLGKKLGEHFIGSSACKNSSTGLGTQIQPNDWYTPSSVSVAHRHVGCP